MFPKKKYIYIYINYKLLFRLQNIYISSLWTLVDKPGHVKVERVDYETEYIKESESFPGHGDMLVAAGGSIDNVGSFSRHFGGVFLGVGDFMLGGW